MEMLSRSRDQIYESVKNEKDEKQRILDEIEELKSEMQIIDESLERKYVARDEFKSSITEMEGALSKIVESA